MRFRLSIFVGLVLCVVLLAAYGLFHRTIDSRDGWRPNAVYSNVGGSSYSTTTFSGVSSSANGLGAPAVSMRGSNSMLRRRAVSSYAPAYSAPTSLIASSPYRLGASASSSVAPVYTTSSATAKSFGSGNAVSGVSMSGGSVRATHSQSSISNSQSSIANIQLPIANIQSPTANTQLPTANTQLPISNIQSPIASNYQGIGNTTIGGPRGLGGRQNAAPTNNDYASWLRWLDMHGYEFADGYDDETGTYTYSEQAAWDAYVDWYNSVYGCNPGEYGGSSPDVTWEMWLGWFKSNNGSHQGGKGWYNFVPVGDYLPLLFMALFYVAYIFIRRREVKKIMN